MKNQHTVQAAFRALADPKRREILLLLRERDMSIGDIVERFNITRAAVKKHLLILEHGRLISVNTKGRERINKLEPQSLRSANEWLKNFSQFWDTRLETLQALVENDKGESRD